ncbi:MAG: DUF262 domain-containing protein, partial [bacterium]
MLRELDAYENWRFFNRMAEGQNYRYVKQEVILRVFAFNDQMEKYTGQVGRFLNEYMFLKRKIDND